MVAARSRRSASSRQRLVTGFVAQKMENSPQLEIDSCAYLFLKELEEIGRGSLRLVLEKAQASTESEAFKIGTTEIPDCHRVFSTPESRLFELVWDHYVVYSVRNESYASDDDNSIATGRRFRIYSRSRFLEFLGIATFATSEYPGSMQHIGLYCEDHIIDVISTKGPRIVRLRPIPDAPGVARLS